MKGQIMYVCTYILYICIYVIYVILYVYICIYVIHMCLCIYKIDIFKTRKFPTNEKACIKPQY